MIKLLLYCVLVALSIFLIIKAKKQTEKSKKVWLSVGASVCILAILSMLTCQSILLPSALRYELIGIDEIKIPQALIDEIDNSEEIDFLGVKVKTRSEISSKNVSNSSHINIRGYRFEDVETAKSMTKKLMTGEGLDYNKLDSILYTNYGESEKVIGFYNYDDPEKREPYVYYFMKDVPFYWARKIKKVGNTTVYSTPTAITVIDDAEGSAFIGRLPIESFYTIFAIQQDEYVFVFTEECDFPTLGNPSAFREWLKDTQNWQINKNTFTD